MSMYVPLFSAVVAKYQGGRADAPRLVSLDEAFAGVDNRNIRDMFRLMTEFSFDFIINSQVLWGDCDTLDALAIYQLIRPENAKFVTVMPYVWNGHSRELMESEEAVEQRRQRLNRQQENNCIAYFKSNPVGQSFSWILGKVPVLWIFSGKVVLQKLQRRKSKDLRDFCKEFPWEKECDGISGAFFAGIAKQQVF